MTPRRFYSLTKGKILKQEKLPNFLIVGAAKAGTTFFYEYCRQHPEVFMPWLKEPRYLVEPALRNVDPQYKAFKKNLVTSFAEYKTLFSGASRFKAVGEASPIYLYYHQVAVEQIKRHLGDPKIVIILRNPVDRALSGYRYLKKRGVYQGSLDMLIEEQGTFKKSAPPFFQVMEMGFYYEALKHYLDNFSRVHIMLFSDLLEHQELMLSELYRFIDVDPDFKPDELKAWNKTTPENIDEPLRNRITEIYAEDAHKTSELIGRPLLAT